MARYRKKPVVIEAVVWHKAGDEPSVQMYFDQYPGVQDHECCGHCGLRLVLHGWIATLEGGHIVCPGDWIIRGVAGEKYPCKPAIFDATYEAVVAQPTSEGGTDGTE